MQNYHRHSYYSNIATPDSSVANEEYAKRAVELGHKIISSVEHGWQGYYFQTYELAKKYNLKCVIGAEAYWVLDRTKPDSTNCHIIILAKNNNGREELNDILSEANITGYYYKPRVDLELLMSLPENDVFITSACIAFNDYGTQISDDVILKLHKKFKDNFMLEIQYQNTSQQKEWNKHLQELSQKYNIKMIVGLDSHYIYPDETEDRDIVLDGRGIHYDHEEGWYMDYPDDNTVVQRFLEQGIFTEKEIRDAMDNSDICLTFDDYDDVHIFTKEIKLPTLFPGETKEQKDKRYSKLVSKQFKEYMKNIPEDQYEMYFEGVKNEVQTYKDTGMCDYPLLDYAIINDAKQHGGLITDTGRGSAVGYFTNTLCGFSNVDRFQSAIKLYPERFISTTRILETHSLPDIDINTGTPEILEESQVRILGAEHVAPMIAFGTLKKKAAFKLYARAKGMDFELANTISNQLSKYDEAIKYADDEEKDLISLYDYVDEQYKPYIEQSEEYWGVISDKKKAPSAYLLYQGNIRREIGLIKCKSESTKKEYITCVIDGAIAEEYKFLKNDILKVDVVLLIDKVFKRIGIEHFDVNTLLEKIKNDKKVWDIYANGYTIGVNQVEKVGSRHKCMRYKPQNVSELSAFVAAIRPGFRSMYDRFEKREDFKWGIDALDNLLRTEELPVSFLFFQEQVMSVLNYAGFPMDECYGIIKAIAKKHPEKVRPLKARFIDGFRERIIADENLDHDTAQQYSEQVWVIINDNCGYGFNSAHAFCMALDSLYQAWQKANYPFEFYEVLLQHYSDKGNKDKVIELKNEMKKAFGIKEGAYKFRKDNRQFTADPENHCIYPALKSIKGIGEDLSQLLYNNRDKQYQSFIELLKDIKIDSGKLDILIKIGYFEEFGEINQLLKIVEIYNFFKKGEAKQLSKNKIPEWLPEYLLKKHCTETEKQYKILDCVILLKEVLEVVEYPKTTLLDKLSYEQEYLGYIQTTIDIGEKYYYISDIKEATLTLYQLKTGETIKIKCRKKTQNQNPIVVGNIIKVEKIGLEPRFKLIKDENGKEILDKNGKKQWYRDENDLEEILQKYLLVKC